MKMFDTGSARLHYREDGNPDGPAIVFSNSLGTDLRVWDAVVERLPKELRIIRYDTRGHGLSSSPEGPYSMGSLVTELERLLEFLNVRDAMIVGLSIGGMIAQGLAVKRLDIVRSIVLSNTAAKIGTPPIWQLRMDTVREHGISEIAEATMERWFAKANRDPAKLEPWMNMLLRTPVDGYLGCAHAISRSDFFSSTSGLRLPALGIAGTEDGATPADMMRETMDLIPGSRLVIIPQTGHMPCVEDPDAFTNHLIDFISETGHMSGSTPG